MSLNTKTVLTQVGIMLALGTLIGTLGVAWALPTADTTLIKAMSITLCALTGTTAGFALALRTERSIFRFHQMRTRIH